MAVDQESSKGTILVVDDEEAIADLLQNMFEHGGYHALRATGFAAARRLLEQKSFDLITLDIMMPDTDGLQVLRWVKERHPEVGVVMATALEDLDAVIEAMRLGAYDYLLKPFRFELVMVQIDRAMERQRLLAENRSYQLELESKVEVQTRELRQLNACLERKVRELEGRDHLLHLQMRGARLRESCAAILQVLYQVLAIEAATLYRPDPSGRRLQAAAAMGRLEAGVLENEGQLATLPSVAVGESSLVAEAFREVQPRHAQGRAALPLLYQERVLGVVAVENWSVDGNEEACNTLWSLSREAALLLWSAQLSEELQSGRVEVDDLLDME